MSNVTVNRSNQIFVNKGGVAHLTGWISVQGKIMRGAASCKKIGKTFAFCSEVKESTAIDCTLPISVEHFISLTGWRE